MNILFEEDGVFRAGTVLADNTTSLQVELASGKRAKVKSANVLQRFAAPAPGELLERAEAEAEGIDTEFLWEVCGEDEFGFEDLAKPNTTAHKPDAVESAAVLLRLHAAPMYFHRKGRGRFRKAPPEILQAALIGLEKKRQQAAGHRAHGRRTQGRPAARRVRPLVPQLLYKPDRNRLETKALEAACAETGKSVARLLLACGALPSSPRLPLRPLPVRVLPGRHRLSDRTKPSVEPPDLPLAECRLLHRRRGTPPKSTTPSRSRPKAGGGWRIGIHIAAPGARLQAGYGLGRSPATACRRSTCRAARSPCCPRRWSSLHPRSRPRLPALSLYLDVAADLRVTANETHRARAGGRQPAPPRHRAGVQRRHHLAGGLPEFEWRDELKLLWELARCWKPVAASRGRARADGFQLQRRLERVTTEGPGRVDIQAAPAGSPLDKLVAELMIVANNTWGRHLRDAGIPALYRAQGAARCA
jgi:exoribonuclease-2